LPIFRTVCAHFHSIVRKKENKVIITAEFHGIREEFYPYIKKLMLWYRI